MLDHLEATKVRVPSRGARHEIDRKCVKRIKYSEILEDKARMQPLMN